MNTQDASADIRAVIRRINSAWLDGPADAITTALLPCFDESVVFCGASFQVVARGATACADSYESFVLLVLNGRGGEWRVVWRALVPASTS